MRKRRRKNLPSSAARSQPTELIRSIPPIRPRVPGPAVKRRKPKRGEKSGCKLYPPRAKEQPRSFKGWGKLLPLGGMTEDKNAHVIGFTEKWPEGGGKRRREALQNRRGKAMRPVNSCQGLEEPGCAESQSAAGGQYFLVRILPFAGPDESPSLQAGKRYRLVR